MTGPTDPLDLHGSLDIVTQSGLVAVLVWIARELGAIRQAVGTQICRWTAHESGKKS